ncbi:ninein-like protein isoform X1 [Pelobates fuscus]|uniref:ninein-like protein isoform X1 n=1 Tax=Pelobates fuscus TaxID=191477 RepID=UPI002FE4BFE8
MDQEEENKYVSQLQDVFNSCDTTGTGYLDKEELTDLCRKLHLDAQLPLLLQTLLGKDIFARVNFDEFKEGFVAVLSSTIDISISEDESSYLEPVIPDEVKPKFVKGTKRYGRRTQPEFEAAENETNKYMQEQHNVKCKRKGQIRRSSSLESVESLKSDEEAESAKEPHNENFEGQGQLRVWESEFFASPGRNASLYCDMTEHQVRAIWEELGVGCNGYLNLQELATVCQNIGLKDFSKEKIEDLFKKLDRDGDGKVSFVEFQLGLFNYAPLPFSSTPLQQRRPWAFCQSAEDSSRKTATSSLLSSCGAIHLFTSIDDGTGFGNPEQIMIIWEEEGIEDSKDLLMSLDFNLEERINLLDLTTALDNELIAAKNRFHLAALASYKHELHYQHGQVNQVTKERDKFKQDLEKAEKRNLQLADEVDDHNSTMEQLNESKIKELEQEYRQRLAFIRTELEREKDQFLQNTDQHRTKMESDLANFQVEEAFLRDKLNLSIKENSRLQKEMVEIVGKLSESEKLVEKLQNTVDRILKEKGVTDPLHSEIFVQEEHFAEIIKQYEAQCRELRDQNDELQIQLETLRSQLSESKYSRLLARMKDNKLLHLKAKEKHHLSNGVTGKKGLSTRLRRSSSAAGADVTVQSENLPMNMETELTKHQIKEQQQEIQDLKIQLETKVIYYEREVELMKSNFEKERRETEQSFKMEISELEEQKADLEGLNTKYQEVIDGLKEQLNKSAHIQDIEKKFEKERVEMEQYYATEISMLGKKLTGEKEQLEEEIKRFHQQELQTMREEAKEELNERLSEIEAQYADYCQTILLRHNSEKEEILRKHKADKQVLMEEHTLQRARWEEQEKATMMQWKKELLKLEEKQNEEQALICKTFAVEREHIENEYHTHIQGLNEEIQLLNARLTEQGSLSCSGKGQVQQKVNLENGQLDDGVDVCFGSPKQQPFSCSDIMPGDGWVCAKDEDQLLKPKMVCGVNLLVNKCELVEMQIKPIEAPHLKVQQVLSFNASEENLAFLKRAEDDAMVKLQETESPGSSPRAQLRGETKEKDGLLKKQKSLEVKTQLVSQLKAKEEECFLSEVKGEQLESQMKEACNGLGDKGLCSQVLVQEWEELQKRVEDLQSLVSELECNRTLMQEKEQDLTAQLEQSRRESNVLRNVCQSLENVEERHLVEELINRNVLLSQQLKNKDDEVYNLQSKMLENVTFSQQMEEEVNERVQHAMNDLEREKDNAKDKLFELEALVREIEARSSLDNRMELSRLSEDNSELKNKLERLQQHVGDLEDLNNMTRLHLEDAERENSKLQSDLKEMDIQNKKYQNEMSQLNSHLNGTVSEILAKQETIQQITSRLQEVTQQREEADATIKQLQETVSALEKEKLQQLLEWENVRQRLEQDLLMSKMENEKYQDELSQMNSQSLQLNGTVSDLSTHNMAKQETIQQLTSKLQEVTQQREEAEAAIKQLQETLSALEKEKLQQLSVWQNERQRLEQELLMYKEKNDKYQDELSQLNSHVNGTVSDLSAQIMAKQETIQQLTSRLQEVTQQREEADAAIKQLQETLSALEKEKLQQLSVWQNQRQRLEQDLLMSKEKNDKYQDDLSRLNSHSLQLNCTVSDLSAQIMAKQETIHQLTSRLPEVAQQKEESDFAVKRLQETLCALEKERLQQLSAWQNESQRLEQELRISKEKVLALEALEVDVSILIKEKQDLQEQCQRVTTQLKETADKVIQMDTIESDLKQAQQECQTLRTVQNQLREQLDESQDQLMEAHMKLTLAQSQHMREVQQLKEQVSSAAPMDQLSHLQDRLLQEQQKVQQMQDKLRFHAEQANRQLAMQQEAHEKLLRKMEDRMESVEMNLKNFRLMLQEKVSQLKEQLERNSKSDLLLKDLYVENAHLMKALQVTEERQKGAEKKNYVLEEKIFALNKVIKKIAPASLAV